LAAGIPARLTTAQLRRFGVTVAGPFLVLAGLAYWRTHIRTAEVFAALSAFFAVTGLLIPVVLRPVHRVWMAGAHALGWFNTRVILTIVWFVAITPIGALKRWFGGDALTREFTAQQSYWVPREAPADPKGAMERWF